MRYQSIEQEKTEKTEDGEGRNPGRETHKKGCNGEDNSFFEQKVATNTTTIFVSSAISCSQTVLRFRDQLLVGRAHPTTTPVLRSVSSAPL